MSALGPRTGCDKHRALRLMRGDGREREGHKLVQGRMQGRVRCQGHPWKNELCVAVDCGSGPQSRSRILKRHLRGHRQPKFRFFENRGNK